jgi:hypothetical protein
MKRNFLFGAILAALTLGSCSTDDTADITIINEGGGGDNNTIGTTFLSGNYQEDLILNSSESYVLNGALVMSSGTTLTIPAGTTINAQSGNDIYIAIAQGAKIIAEGTATEPIVFTSNQAVPQAGDWGGLIVLGRAPINSVSGNATSTSEVGNLPYGGTISEDNSGIISYVRVEYSGGSADGQTENNGISFYGVGNGTTVNYIQAYEGKDDGIEFFGGTVNASNVIVVNAQDDSVDWTEGYTGTLTDVYIKHGTEHDKGIEADGFNTDIGNNSDPVFWSSPTVTNLTIKGNGNNGDGTEAIRLRAGTEGNFTNVLLEGFDEGFDLDDNQTGLGVLSNDLQVTDVTFTDVSVNVKNDTEQTFTDADFLTGSGNGVSTDINVWGANWSVGL